MQIRDSAAGLFMGLALLFSASASSAEKKSQSLGANDFAQAEALFESGAYAEALAHYKAFVAGHPASKRCIQARYMFGFILLKKLDHPAEAREAFKALIQDYPASPQSNDARFHLAEACERAGELDEALHYYRELQEKAPRHSRAAMARKKVLQLNALRLASPGSAPKDGKNKHPEAASSERQPGDSKQ